MKLLPEGAGTSAHCSFPLRKTSCFSTCQISVWLDKTLAKIMTKL